MLCGLFICSKHVCRLFHRCVYYVRCYCVTQWMKRREKRMISITSTDIANWMNDSLSANALISHLQSHANGREKKLAFECHAFSPGKNTVSAMDIGHVILLVVWVRQRTSGITFIFSQRMLAAIIMSVHLTTNQMWYTFFYIHFHVISASAREVLRLFRMKCRISENRMQIKRRICKKQKENGKSAMCICALVNSSYSQHAHHHTDTA